MQNDAATVLEKYNRIGLGISIGGHIILLYILLLGIGSGLSKIPENVIYSVSIEGSTKKGGVAQVPKKKSKTPVAPPKNIKKTEAPKKKEPVVKAKEKVQEKPKKVPKKKDAEVSLKEKVKEKPKPTPPPKQQVKKEKAKPKAKPAPVKKKETTEDVNKNFEQALQRYLGESTNAGGQGFGGDGRGGSGMGGGVVKPPAWFLYKDQLEMAVKRGWNWHDKRAELLASVAFNIAPDGTLTGVRLSRGSGNSHFDESVLRAVRKANPVPAPPAEFYTDFRAVEIDFEP